MIKILIVDDSPTEAALIQAIIDSTNDMQVIGVAKNGEEAIELTKKLNPDLITMDIQMPVMDGLEATRVIMAQNPTPIVVISSRVNDESINSTFHILEAGALTALAKPTNIFSPSFAETKAHIIDTIRSLVDIKVIKKPLKKQEEIKNGMEHLHKRNYEIIAIGASVGGPLAIKKILSELSSEFPIPIVIVQHMTTGFINGFAEWLSYNVSIKVKNAVDNEKLQKGMVYIAQEYKHMEITRNNDSLICKLVDGAPISGFCPSITKLMQSVAKTSADKAIGILLTGMSDDGAEGLLELKKAHGLTLIQDEASSIVFGMGAVALSLKAVNYVVELDNIASFLKKICTSKSE